MRAKYSGGSTLQFWWEQLLALDTGVNCSFRAVLTECQVIAIELFETMQLVREREFIRPN